MTNKVVFTFTNPTKPVASSPVTRADKQVDSETAQKATAVMTGIFNDIVTKIKIKSPDHYKSIMESKKFKVSFELPTNGDAISVQLYRFEKNDEKETIKFNLGKDTSQK